MLEVRRLISFLKAIILNSLSENYLGSVTRKLLFPLVVSHFVFLGVVLLSLPLKEESRLPVFPAQLCMRNAINCRPCWRLWGVLRPFLWICPFSHLLFPLAGGILKSICLLSTRQSQVKCQEPSTGVPQGSSLKCSSFCVFSQSCRVGQVFCMCS